MPSETMLSETGAREHPIGSLEQIPPGEGRNFEVDGTMIAVFRTRAGTIFATQAACPHRGGPLADGMVGGGVVMCPLHDRSYDLVSGQELGGDCRLTVYPVRQGADHRLWVTVPASSTTGSSWIA